MSKKYSTTDTIHRLKTDDLAKMAVMRLQRDPELLSQSDRNIALKNLAVLADDLFESLTMPNSIAGWIALVLFHGETTDVNELRLHAQQRSDGSYIQAETWLRMIDQHRVSSST
jgi:hypothetical protein